MEMERKEFCLATSSLYCWKFLSQLKKDLLKFLMNEIYCNKFSFTYFTILSTLLTIKRSKTFVKVQQLFMSMWGKFVKDEKEKKLVLLE